MMRIEVPEAADVLCLVASHFAVKEAGLGTLSAFGVPRGDAAPLVEAAGLEEAAQRRIGRQGCEIRIVLRESREIVVVQPHTPALVGGILGDDRPAYRAAHRRLPSGVGAQLAAQHAHGIAPLLQSAVIPALDRREAKSDGLARRRVLPGALCQCGNGGGELALAR